MQPFVESEKEWSACWRTVPYSRVSSGTFCLLHLHLSCFRYQRIELTKEQLEEIAARVASEAAEKQALLSNYAKKKAENEDREKLEADRLAVSFSKFFIRVIRVKMLLLVFSGLKKRYGWKENGGKLWREKSQRNRWKLAVIPRSGERLYVLWSGGAFSFLERHFQSSRGTC